MTRWPRQRRIAPKGAEDGDAGALAGRPQQALVARAGDVVQHHACHRHSRMKAGEAARQRGDRGRSEEHTSELQSLMRISYAVFCLKKTNNQTSAEQI